MPESSLDATRLGAPAPVERPIVVIDSGIGGLLVAHGITGAMPDRDLLVIADHARAPYGPLSTGELVERLGALVELTLPLDPSVIVLACNTATVSAITALRERFSVPFVGFEPAVRPAALHSVTRSIGVLATAGSLAAERFQWLCDTYSPEVRVTSVAAPELVALVEDAADPTHARAVVAETVRPLVEAGVDVVALGCTHFPFLRDELEAALGPSVRLIDPTPAVIRSIDRLGPPGLTARPGRVVIVDTDDRRQAATEARWGELAATPLQAAGEPQSIQ